LKNLTGLWQKILFVKEAICCLKAVIQMTLYLENDKVPEDAVEIVKKLLENIKVNDAKSSKE
jgi:acetolactate synthase small subunit